MRHLYLSNRFFYLFGMMAVLFALGYVVPAMFMVGMGVFCVAVVLTW